MGSQHAYALASLALASGCNPVASTAASDAVTPSTAGPVAAVDSPGARLLREHLVSSLIARGDLHPGRVADAMRAVPRHAFIPEVPLDDAYADTPMPIGFDQTISQPAVVAIMTEALELSGRERVLEIGTGSGYQAAVLGLLSREVDSIETVMELARRSGNRLADLGYANVHVRSGDGYLGWPERAPFDRILVTAAPPAVPQTLLDQLAEGGVLVAPIGPSPYDQQLLRYRKSEGRLRVDDLGPVVFVPMVHTTADAPPVDPPDPPTLADDFVAQARTLARVAACGTDDRELPSRFDAKVVEDHCNALRSEYAHYRRHWLDVAAPLLASIVPKDLPPVVVYPFGGGDVLSALATFPNAAEFLTMSLEAAGDVRAIDSLDASELGDALLPVRQLVAKHLLVSFLSTKNLDLLAHGALPGELVLTLVALTIHGYEPVSLRYFDLQADGTLRYASTDTRNVDLRFRASGGAGAAKVLLHLAVNLDDAHLAKNKGLVALLESKGRFAAMTKAGSHLLWMDSFSTLRRLLLDRMEWMISDTTGIPPRFARAAGFVQDAYGTYDGPDPYGPSAGRDVEDFSELFRRAPTRPLPFWYGYPDKDHHGLLVVTRR